jgi:hypothetical protein
MFIADQGDLPAADTQAAKMWRNIKAKSVYQHIVARVDKAKKDREAYTNIYGDSAPHQGSGEGGGTGQDGQENRGASGELMAYQPPTGMPGSGGPGGQIMSFGNSTVSFILKLYHKVYFSKQLYVSNANDLERYG